MTLKPWQYTGSTELADVKIFKLLRETAVSPRNGSERSYARIVGPEWVNVIAVTAERELLLVRQWRHGVRGFRLEIPGGLVDPGEEPATAAAREVREETGHVGARAVQIGVVEPNPAIQDNRCYTYLIENCRPVGDLELDPGEDIEVVKRPLTSIPELVDSGEIDHALVICGFWWLGQARPDLVV